MSLLIAIEGIDGSGKGTQAAQLHESLKREGRRAALLSFPRYDATQFGKAIGEFLNGRFGSLNDVHPQLASLLFAGDRYESKSVIIQALAEHDIVICDRYVASNVAHQAAKRDGTERSELIEWIESIEYGVYALPRPDLTLLLDLAADSAQVLIAKKAARAYTDQAADLQEADAVYLERVRRVYRDLADGNESWAVIAVESEGAVRPLDDIAKEIRSAVGRSLAKTERHAGS